MKKQIIKFLLSNGFKKMETNSYANDMCNVVFENKGITLANNRGVAMYFKTDDIHGYLWLYGALQHFSFTAYNLTPAKL